VDIPKIAVLFGGYDIGSGITTYYPLDEGSGILVHDHSQYGNHGILKNGPTWGLEDGVMGVTFDGADDYIEDSEGRHIVKEGTTGFWSEVKIGDKTKIVGSGTKFYFSNAGDNLEGQFVSDFADYCTALTTFYCNSNAFSGTLPSFAACTSLSVFYCDNNAFSGTLPSFAACTLLVRLYCYNNAFSGTLPSFAACTNLDRLYCYNNSFSGYESGGFATQAGLSTLDMHDNAIIAAADINQILADLVTSSSLGGRVGCTVKLEGGTNAAPTGQGITDKDTLNAIDGWTVTTN